MSSSIALTSSDSEATSAVDDISSVFIREIATLLGVLGMPHSISAVSSSMTRRSSASLMQLSMKNISINLVTHEHRTATCDTGCVCSCCATCAGCPLPMATSGTSAWHGAPYRVCELPAPTTQPPYGWVHHYTDHLQIWGVQKPSAFAGFQLLQLRLSLITCTHKRLGECSTRGLKGDGRPAATAYETLTALIEISFSLTALIEFRED